MVADTIALEQLKTAVRELIPNIDTNIIKSMPPEHKKTWHSNDTIPGSALIDRQGGQEAIRIEGIGQGGKPLVIEGATAEPSSDSLQNTVEGIKEAAKFIAQNIVDQPLEARNIEVNLDAIGRYKATSLQR